jgi:hypothetical protein
MAQDSKVKRRMRRLKRENSLLYRELELRMAQTQQLAQMLMQSRQDWKELKATLEEAEQQEMQPTPTLTITKVEDELDSPEGAQFEEDHLGVVRDETEAQSDDSATA